MENLTRREEEIYGYVCNGYTNEEIAEILYISKHTVKAHVSAILNKIGARNRVYAAYLGGQNIYYTNK